MYTKSLLMRRVRKKINLSTQKIKVFFHDSKKKSVGIILYSKINKLQTDSATRCRARLYAAHCRWPSSVLDGSKRFVVIIIIIGNNWPTDSGIL